VYAAALLTTGDYLPDFSVKKSHIRAELGCTQEQ
jgi:hypothetical protein